MTATATHLSYSQTNQLRSCSWQYKLARVDRVEERPSVPAVAGKAIHFSTEYVDKVIHVGNGDAYGLEASAIDIGLSKFYEYEAEEGTSALTWKYFGRQDYQWFRDTGIPRAVGSYLDWRLANPSWQLIEVPGHGLSIEVPFEYYVAPGVPVHGYIDRIFAVNGELVVLDIKSGRKPESSEQLGLYAAALKAGAGLGWEVNTGYYLYGLKNGQASLTKPADLTVWSPKNLSNLYATARKTIDQKLFIPHPGERCFFACSVSHACEYSRATI